MKLIAGNANKKGHYSPGVLVGNILYISGQLPIDPETGQLAAGDIEAQTKAALGNVERVLTAAGLAKTDVAMCRVYIPDMAYWDTVNDIYADFFGEHKPARVIVPTRELHHGALVEIEAMAEKREDP
ncbi:MAG: RidA family protein [Clostridia bacterium]|nr:RidA family protein [Clostridia bacterium]